MEERQSILIRKRELTPKITSTKMTIGKSTPFFITKHHLDDTQMRSVLNYNYDDRTLKKNQRAHSYHAEVISCRYSKIKEPFSTFQHQSNLIKGEGSKMEYYGEKQDKFVQVEAIKKQSRTASNQVSTNKISKRKLEEAVSRIQESKRISSITQTNDYCLQQGNSKLEEQRKQMRETKKMKEINKEKVMRDIRSVSKQKVKDLRQEIRQIKIKNLEIQRQRLIKEYAAQSQKPAEPISLKTSKKDKPKPHFDFHYSIINKPRFRFKQSCDSDSSFSSFQLE